MYEARDEPLLSRPEFARRILAHAGLAFALLSVSLAGGVAGYMLTERLPALDAFLNAAMLLGGMGPVDKPVTPGGKLFAGCYALYAGLVFIVAAALVVSPVLHRVLHRFHVGDD